jgi:hypothetical protein
LAVETAQHARHDQVVAQRAAKKSVEHDCCQRRADHAGEIIER